MIGLHHNSQMTTILESKWSPRVATALISLSAIGAATYWVKSLSAERSLAAPAPTVEATVVIDSATVALLLGAKKQSAVMPASLASRFALRGVVASYPASSAALISVDGKPAQTFKVGQSVAENLVLQSVVGRTALLGTEMGGSSIVSLEMPTLRN
jgi:general secretion pathway protein C